MPVCLRSSVMVVLFVVASLARCPARASQAATDMADGTSYQDLADSYADQYGVDRNLFRRLIQQESGFDPNAVSPVGARGLGQVMPATAADPGYGVTPLSEDMIDDPEENLRFAAEYFSAMQNKFDGDPRLALAAYNAGAGAVQKYGDVPPYPETQDYVSKIMGPSYDAFGDVYSDDTSRNAAETLMLDRSAVAGEKQASNKSSLDDMSDALAYLDLSGLSGGAKESADLGARITPGRAGGGARALKRMGIASLV